MVQKYIKDIKIIGDIYDEYSVMIIQLIRFLYYQSTDYVQYGLLLPKNPLKVLIGQFKIPFEIVFEIVRPGTKHISTMNSEEWR